MAPIDTMASPRATVDMEIPVKWSGSAKNHWVIDAVLRALVFVTCLAGIIVLVTSKQSRMLPVSPTMVINVDAKYNHSPAYTYFLSAFTVACFYSIITATSSILALKKIGGSSEKLQSRFVMLDALLLAIVSSALGAAFAVAYIGLKGNHHTGWRKICNKYGIYCHHIVGSLTMGFICSTTLLLLIMLSFYTLTKKIVKR